MTPHEIDELDWLLAPTEPKLSFREFIALVNPRYQFYPHVESLIAVLQRVADDDLKRLMVFMPPRHGKSELVSRLFPAYYLYRHPERFVAISSYAAELAYTLSRAARDNYLRAGGTLKDDAAAVKQWETGEGGGLWAAGVGGPATGKGWHLGITDDPIKNAEEAASEVIRAKQKDWWRSTWLTREEPGGAIIVVQTRWNEDDLCGWLLSEEGEDEEGEGEGWHIVSMAAIKEIVSPDFPASCTVEPDARQPGAALCPPRYPLAKLRKMAGRLGTYFWNALYQQRPAAREGGYFKREWWSGEARYDPMDRNLAAIAKHRWILWDTALSEKATSAYSAAIVVDLLPDYRLVVREVWRARLAFPDLVTQITDLAKRYNVDGKLKGLVIEDKSSGTSAIQTLAASADKWLRKLLVPFMPTGSKEARAGQAAVWVENGSILLPEPSLAVPWLSDFEAELFNFPNSKNKDQVDILSMAALYLEPYLAVGYKRRHRQEAA